MTPVRYDAEITIWTEDGFRLDSRCHSRQLWCEPEEGVRTWRPRSTAGDIARRTSVRASLQPGTTDYERKAYPFRRRVPPLR